MYDALRDAIQSGRLRAGDRLVISHIGLELGVSDVPVREALFQLEAEGLIDNEPHVGVTVAGLDALEVQDVYLASAIIESAAAALATPHMTDGDQQYLQTTLKALDPPSRRTTRRQRRIWTRSCTARCMRAARRRTS